MGPALQVVVKTNKWLFKQGTSYLGHPLSTDDYERERTKTETHREKYILPYYKQTLKSLIITTINLNLPNQLTT